MIDYFINNNIENFRYERKFAISQLSLAEIYQLINLHPAAFSEIFYERQVNNIYLDTPDRIYLNDNLIGTSKRLKVRIRWYGDTFGLAEEPNLEFKIKNNNLNTKEIFSLSDLKVGRPIKQQELVEYFRKADLPANIYNVVASLEPSLLNTYHRRYFQSADKCFRLTVDHGLSYYQIESQNDNLSVDLKNAPYYIVELKYNTGFDDKAKAISSKFPFRITKNSKYVDGLTQLSKHI